MPAVKRSASPATMQVDEEGPAKPRRILKVKRNAASAGVKREVPADPIPQMDFRPQKEKPPPEKKQKSNEGKAKARPQKRKLFKVWLGSFCHCAVKH